MAVNVIVPVTVSFCGIKESALVRVDGGEHEDENDDIQASCRKRKLGVRAGDVTHESAAPGDIVVRVLLQRESQSERCEINKAK